MAKKKVKSKTDIDIAEANGRISQFNKELQEIAEKYQVRLDISQRIVVVDNKPSK